MNITVRGPEGRSEGVGCGELNCGLFDTPNQTHCVVAWLGRPVDPGRSGQPFSDALLGRANPLGSEIICHGRFLCGLAGELGIICVPDHCALIARRAVRGYDITTPICRRQAQVAPKNSASVSAATILDSNRAPLWIMERKREGVIKCYGPIFGTPWA